MTTQATAKRTADRLLKAAHELVYERSQGRCEITGQRLISVQFHHRDPRGMGGSSRNPRYWDQRNLLALSPDAHQRVEHNRTWAEDLGYLARNYQTTPFLLHGRRIVLAVHGGYQEVPVDDLLAQLYRERYSQPVRGRNSLLDPPGSEWERLRELQDALRSDIEESA